MIELLIVIAVLAILAGFALTSGSSGQRKARDTQRITHLKGYQSELEKYSNTNNVFPTTSGLLTNLCATLRSSGCPEDPKSGMYQYVADSEGLSYYAWATMEMPDDDGNVKYYVVCSDGKSGETSTQPTGGTCPI